MEELPYPPRLLLLPAPHFNAFDMHPRVLSALWFLGSLSLSLIFVGFTILAILEPHVHADSMLRQSTGLELSVVPTPPDPAPVVVHEENKPQEVRVLFVGDMFFDRQIRFVSDYNGPDFPFSCIDPLLSSADMVVGNLEGPVTNSPSVSLGSIVGSANNYQFTFPTTTPMTLLRHNIRAVTLGNNHILNFGYDGLAQTHQYLAQAGLSYFGGVKGSEPVYRTDVQGIPLSFVGFNEFGGADAVDVAHTIAQEKKEGRVVVVFSHWGTEYSTSADEMRPWATLFAASGASAVIGAHPHVVGEHEQIGSTTVYYSLGNFIFDQYFSQAVTHGLAVMLTLNQDGVVGAQEYPVRLERDGRTCLAE